ncbi:MAG: hypothetical protein GY737_29705 [Desulfobacteraceae bacterium]|nr:hypothetical protein [Desulfobacteraceae bacterium]
MAKDKKKSRRDNSQQLFFDYNCTKGQDNGATQAGTRYFGKRFPRRDTASQGYGRKNKGRQAP